MRPPGFEARRGSVTKRQRSGRRTIERRSEWNEDEGIIPSNPKWGRQNKPPLGRFFDAIALE